MWGLINGRGVDFESPVTKTYTGNVGEELQPLIEVASGAY